MLDGAVTYGVVQPGPAVESGVPMLRVNNFRGYGLDTSDVMRIANDVEAKYTRTRLRKDDVLMTVVGSVGQVAVVPEKLTGWNLARAVALLRPRENSMSRWIALCLRAPSAQHALGMAANTTVQTTINLKDLRKIELPMPPQGERVAIQEVLSALDDRIDLLRQTNATLESIAQSLFKSWFIDFDPVRAKAEGREPEGMDAATAALFPAEFEESALGGIPKGWRVAAVSDVVENVYDGPHATPPEATAGPVFLGIKNLTGTSLDLGDVRYIGEDNWAQWTRRVTPQVDDIVFSYEAALGLFALIPPDLRCCLGRRLALVRTKPEGGTPHFWFHQFVGAPFQRLLEKHTVQGATVNRIALREFPSFSVMDPGGSLRAAFEAVAGPLWARIHANRQQALSLADLRDTLLPRLISGKLRLPEARTALASMA